MTLKSTMIGLLCGVAVLWAANAFAAADPSAEPALYSEKGDKTCLKCHDEAPYNSVMHTKHGVAQDPRTPAANHGCESCHGPSAAHASARPPKGEKRPLPAIVFSGPGASSSEARSEVCLTCHKNSARMKWNGSQHASNEVGCNNCHTVHADKDPILSKATEPEKCFSCHSQQRADSFQYSHHPVREGKVSCSDCHNTHGSAGPKLVKAVSINATCYACHADKRGPYLFEHQPVRENCDNCHNPHGSPQAAMLTERQPYLCSSCHSAASNQSGGWFGGKGSLPGGHTQTNYMNNRSCLNCHSNIHGSNSPAGEAFLR